MTSPISSLHRLGQSIWYDNIERCLLENGEMASLITQGEIRGVTSNPSIFRNAIANSQDYDPALIPMAWAGWSAEQIYEQLAIEDIRSACDLLSPLYQESHGEDGYVSLEVNPRLAYETVSTHAEACRLWAAVNRPNLMIKIPATLQGLQAVRDTIASGINVNVTLIFSIARYRQVMEAYLLGLEDRLAARQPVDRIASVASFFVSRIDKKVDTMVAGRAPHLQGVLAIANAKLAYQEFRQVFEGERYIRLKDIGARFQRPLWASTSTKHSPNLPPATYVESLIGPHTVNTVPPVTLEAFRQQGVAKLTLEEDLPAARRAFDEMATLGISMEQVTRELEQEGVRGFLDDFTAMLQTVEQRRQQAVRELGPLAKAVARRVNRIETDSVPARLWDHDPTLWTQDPAGKREAQNRLGWLDLPFGPVNPETSPDALNLFAKKAHKAGFTHVLLLGMGGSSLAPEVMSLVNKPEIRISKFGILDSTDPAQVRATARQFPIGKTLFIVSSKSGGTAEVQAMLNFFWERACRVVGEQAREHFVAITDPKTDLQSLAESRGWKVFFGEPTVGGRYSVLSLFGLVPAALMGLDIATLLGRAEHFAQQCRRNVPAARNPGLVLGAVLGEMHRQKRDKLTLIADSRLDSFGSWLEQLVAESSGKDGAGIVPIDGEPPTVPSGYGQDRLFVYFRMGGRYQPFVNRLLEAGFPVLTFPFDDGYDLGAEFYRWEVATAIACAILSVNAFDQPDVQDSKNRTKEKIKIYRQTGKLVEGKPVKMGPKLKSALKQFFAQAKPEDYVALNAYLPRNRQTVSRLRRLRSLVRQKTGLATTVGFGPRFLHSTGQLHKGGADNGLFIQITADPVVDLEIPGEGMTFGTLERAQALGDLEALQDRGRRVLRVHLPTPAALADLLKYF